MLPFDQPDPGEAREVFFLFSYKLGGKTHLLVEKVTTGQFASCMHEIPTNGAVIGVFGEFVARGHRVAGHHVPQNFEVVPMLENPTANLVERPP